MSHTAASKNVLRAVFYVRVSTKLLVQEESLKNQISFFENYVKQKEVQLVDMYIDDGFSVTSVVKRREMQRLMSDAESGKFDIVYVKSISRWSRDTVDSLNLVRKLRSLNISLRSITENYDSLTDPNEFLLTLHSALAQQESDLMSSRIKFGFSESARKGQHHGTPPYGYYKKQKGQLTPHPVHSITIKEIFKLYLQENWGMQKIANYLTSRNIPTPQTAIKAKNAGEKWHDSTIKSILINPHYTGVLVQGRETTDDNNKKFLQEHGYKSRVQLENKFHIVVPNTHDALVSQHDFDMVQEKLKKKAASKFSGRGKKSLFARLAFCADCSAGMNYKKDRKGYVCGTYQKNGSKRCSSHIIKHSKLKAAVFSDLTDLANRSVNMNSLLQTALNHSEIKNIHFNKELTRINKEIKNVQNEITSITRAFAKGDIKNDVFKTTLDVITKEQEALYKKASELNEMLSVEQNMEDQLITFKKELQKLINLQLSDEEILRSILQNLINKIEVFDNGDISIHYNFRNPN
ncbi:hypothetical protein CEW92_14870 [Bacillaceae bacterium SAS-127]|nr:hypothetical protein CEW92_14870 [Bacillaceae bacterium SAS-127]